MDNTTHPIEVEVQPFTITVSAAGAELHITYPALRPVLNSSGQYVCQPEGIEKFDGLSLQLLDLLSRTIEDIYAWRLWTLNPSDHIAGFAPSLTYGLPDPVELT